MVEQVKRDLGDLYTESGHTLDGSFSSVQVTARVPKRAPLTCPYGGSDPICNMNGIHADASADERSMIFAIDEIDFEKTEK